MKQITGARVTAVAIVLLAIGAAEAVRMRGEPYAGVQMVNTPRPALAEASQFQGRAVGGSGAEIGEFPYMVSLQNRFGNHFCGGVFIDEEYVLTAASCVAGLKKNQFYVFAGGVDWMYLYWYWEVADIHVHCNFDKPLYHNDLALIRLKAADDARVYGDPSFVDNITIAIQNELVEGEELTFTGWGNTKGGEAFPNQLTKLTAFYMPHDKCKLAYGNSEDVDLGHLCTSNRAGEGFCHGDTGGPLVNSKNQLVGIANWGVPCGRGFPDVYARVSYYNDWIRTTIKGCRYDP